MLDNGCRSRAHGSSLDMFAAQYGFSRAPGEADPQFRERIIHALGVGELMATRRRMRRAFRQARLDGSIPFPTAIAAPRGSWRAG
jgi:hypothetical protein